MGAADVSFGTLLGVDHIGIGVSDMDASIAFYGGIGFTDIVFDYTGPLGGIAAVSGHAGHSYNR